MTSHGPEIIHSPDRRNEIVGAVLVIFVLGSHGSIMRGRQLTKVNSLPTIIVSHVEHPEHRRYENSLGVPGLIIVFIECGGGNVFSYASIYLF